jgi:hypothetical protein
MPFPFGFDSSSFSPFKYSPLSASYRWKESHHIPMGKWTIKRGMPAVNKDNGRLVAGYIQRLDYLAHSGAFRVFPGLHGESPVTQRGK